MILNNHKRENLVLMQNGEHTLLLHETDKKTIFQSPRSYEIVVKSGKIDRHDGFFVMNHIPLTDEGRPVFEYRFKNRSGFIENAPGFKALRVLRPVHSDTYIILTEWQNEEAFNRWKKSKTFENAHKKQQDYQKEEDKTPIYPRPSYVTTYFIPKEDN
ncbi:antibiotic biosynthesis monooxygenase family protein [Oikeobacillus pervagus]